MIRQIPYPSALECTLAIYFSVSLNSCSYNLYWFRNQGFFTSPSASIPKWIKTIGTSKKKLYQWNAQKSFITIRQKIPLPLGGKQEPLQGHLFLHPQDASLPLPAPWLPLMGHGITEDIIGRGQTWWRVPPLDNYCNLHIHRQPLLEGRFLKEDPVKDIK